MPPCRTVQLTCPPSRPHSLAMMASASSADWRCCTSKSGGTYSASITGVIGRTLSRRMLPMTPVMLAEYVPPDFGEHHRRHWQDVEQTHAAARDARERDRGDA